MDSEFDLTLCDDGTISMAPADAEDFESLREPLIRFAREVGDGIVIETECQSAADRHALAERLAAMFLREVR